MHRAVKLSASARQTDNMVCRLLSAMLAKAYLRVHESTELLETLTIFTGQPTLAARSPLSLQQASHQHTMDG